MSKKLMSVLLVAVLVLSMGTVAMASVSADELPAKPDGYNRYYFYMPESWYNDYATTAGIYWWEGTDACSAWPGYVANETDIEGLYYYDVCQDVTTIIWNNAVDGGTDIEAEIYTAAYQTKNIGSEYYDVDESVNYPDGTDSFDEMIYVVDESMTEVNDFSGKSTFAGEWFYYYGNGEYGFTPEKSDVYFNARSYNGAPEPVVEEETEATTEAPVVTEPETGVIITVDGVEYTAQVGDIITYTAVLTTPANIENVQAYTTYDAANLALVDADAATRFPNMTGVVANATDGTVYFNASEISAGFDFTAGAALITLQFEVLTETGATIDTVIEEMVEYFGDDFVTGGEYVNDAVALEQTLVVPEPEVTTTAAPETEATTVAPETEATTAAPETEATTAEATEAATTATAAGTDATSATEDASKPAGPDAPATGATVAIFATMAVLAMAAAAVVVLRKKVNG